MGLLSASVRMMGKSMVRMTSSNRKLRSPVVERSLVMYSYDLGVEVDDLPLAGEKLVGDPLGIDEHADDEQRRRGPAGRS